MNWSGARVLEAVGFHPNSVVRRGQSCSNCSSQEFDELLDAKWRAKVLAFIFQAAERRDLSFVAPRIGQLLARWLCPKSASLTGSPITSHFCKDCIYLACKWSHLQICHVVGKEQPFEFFSDFMCFIFFCHSSAWNETTCSHLVVVPEATTGRQDLLVPQSRPRAAGKFSQLLSQKAELNSVPLCLYKSHPLKTIL